MKNRVFFPQASLDQWGIEGKIEVNGGELVVLTEGRRYTIVEAVRILVEVTGAGDPHGILGKSKPTADLQAMGAEILESSLILGDNAYDVVPGWLGAPTSSFADHLMSEDRMKARGYRTDIGSPPKSDEEMLGRFVAGALT